MAETPKGDTTSSTDAPDTIRASTGRADAIAADVTSKTGASKAGASKAGASKAGASKTGADSVDGGTIAGDAGADSLASAEAAGETASPASDRVAEPAAGDRPATATAPARGGGLRRTLILVILVALVAGGGYASYPMWRAEVEPLARQLGIALPPVQTARAPEAAEPAAPPKAPESAKAPAAKPSAPVSGTPVSGTGSQTASTPAPSPAPVPAPAKAPTPPVAVSDPALAGDIDRLADRMSAMEERLAALESRPAAEPKAPEPPKADAAALDALTARVDEMAQTLTAATDEVAIVREGLASSGGGEGLGPMAEKLSERLQGLTDRIEALETAPAKPAVAPERIDGLQAGLDEAKAQRSALQTGLDELKAQRSELRAGLDRQQARIDEVAGSVAAAAKADADARAALESRLAELQTRVDGLAGALDSTRSGRERAGAFLLAANQLAAAAAGSGGFAPELEALRAATPADDAVTQALETLRGHAGGVPSLAVLRLRFDGVASAAVRASIIGRSDGVVGQALNRIASLVTVRRTDVTEGDSLDALLVQAETALAAGDVAAALASMKKLDGEPARAAAAWISDAEARAAVDAAVRTLQSKALADVAGG